MFCTSGCFHFDWLGRTRAGKSVRPESSCLGGSCRGRGAPATATQASQHAVDLRLLDRFLAEMQNAVSLSDTFTKAVFKSET